MPDHLVPMRLCPVCGHTLDGATNTDDECRAPCEGDYMICIECTTVLEYGANGDLSVFNGTVPPDVWLSRERLIIAKQLTEFDE